MIRQLPPELLEQAACKDLPTDIFYPNIDVPYGHLLPEVVAVRSICDECPIQDECLYVGMAEKFGIWGGLLPTERRRLHERNRYGRRQRDRATLITARTERLG